MKRFFSSIDRHFAQFGLAALEVIVALGIMAPVIVGAMLTLHSATAAWAKVKARYELDLQQSRLMQHLEQAMAGLDSHRLPLLPRIHANGRITLTNGAALSVMTGAIERRPNPNSDAFTAIKLAPIDSLWITERQISGEFLDVNGCLQFRSKASLSQYRSFIGVSSMHLLELESRSISEPANGCYRLRLRAVESLSAQAVAIEALNFLQVVVPISEHFTIYQSNGLELRYIAHVGREIIENQPIIQSKSVFKLNFNLSVIPEIYELKATLLDQELAPREISLRNRLSRVSQINNLVNRIP